MGCVVCASSLQRNIKGASFTPNLASKTRGSGKGTIFDTNTKDVEAYLQGKIAYGEMCNVVGQLAPPFLLTTKQCYYLLF